MRFVVIATVRRGVLDTPELLDEAGEMAAFWRLRHDESQDLRVTFEMAMADTRVVWNRIPVRQAGAA